MNPSTYAVAGLQRTEPSRNSGLTGMPGIPVAMAKVGDCGTVIKIEGKEETRRFLAGLGFTPGTTVRAVCEASGNMILEVKGSKVAIDRKMAMRILFCPES